VDGFCFSLAIPGEIFMRNLTQRLALGAVVLSFGAGLALAQPASPPPPPMGLTSSSFTDGGIIPDKYTQASPSPISP